MRTSTLDWGLFLPALLLSLSGLVYVYSAAWQPQAEPGPYFAPMFIKQLSFVGLSLLLFWWSRRINWGLRPRSFWFVLGPSVVLLLLVLAFGHGPTAESTIKSWLSLGPVDMQPSEFAKLAFIMVLAWVYSDTTGTDARHFRLTASLLLMLLGLVLAQPDLGTSLVFIFAFFVVSALAGVRRSYLAAVAAAFGVLAIIVWNVKIGDRALFADYQKNRIYAFIDAKADPQGFGYQYKQSVTAIGSGGLFGKGFLRGTQVQRNLVPVVESDFIFALIGEEFGFIGCFWVLLLFLLLLARVLALSGQANTPYERLICYGVSAAILCHILISVGMTLRLTPITGIPLPFVSYGGSSMLTMWAMIALCQSVYANTRVSLAPERRRMVF